MSASKRTATALTLLLPAGVMGLSAALAVNGLQTTEHADNTGSVAERLSDIRKAVSSSMHHNADNTVVDANGVKLTLAEWLNFGGGWGWHNGGWGNGWHNGGWGNGWHNGGWGNGGWHNWGNGWHNFWHNW
jgi:rSAM-associated Gly-rich repeat protein